MAIGEGDNTATAPTTVADNPVLAAPEDYLYSWAPLEEPPPAPLRRSAVATLVFGILGVVPVSVVLGIRWLVGQRGRYERGRGYVFGGFAFSAGWCLVLVGVLVAGFIGRQPTMRHPGELAVGECFTLPGEPGGVVGDVPVVPCTQPHDSELIGGANLSGASLTLSGAQTDPAGGACDPVLAGYVLDPLGLPAGSKLYYFLRDAAGDEYPILCFIRTPTPISHSVRADAQTLTPDQYRFLTIIGPVDDLLGKVLAGDATTAWELRRDAAGDLVTALDQEWRALASGAWPAPVKAAVTALIAAEQPGLPLWRQAGEAGQEAAFQALATRAAPYLSFALQREVRTALGLPTPTGTEFHQT